jgi:hypothetical protein
MGLDEVSCKKGPRDFVAIMTGRMEPATVLGGVLPERKPAPVKALLRGIPQRVRHMIHFGWTAMDAGCVQAAQAVFGKRVQSVSDRFPVATLSRRGLER